MVNDDQFLFRHRFSRIATLLLSSSLLVTGAVACSSSDAGEDPPAGDPIDAGSDASDIPDAADDSDSGDLDAGPDAEDDADTEDPNVARVEVTPAAATVKEGRTVQLEAKAFDAEDAELSDVEIEWTTEDEKLATVDSAGLVTSLRPGEVTITATAGDKSAKATLTITESTVESFELGAATTEVPLDGSVTLVVTIKDDEGFELLRDIDFTSDDESKAVVDEDGKVSGVDLGEATITAKLGDLEESIDLSVVLRFSRIFASSDNTCGLTPIGRAFCWGGNGAGQLGNGDESGEPKAAPVRVAVDPPVFFQTLALGDRHACGLTHDEKVWCWGSNSSGQLGKTPGSPTSSATPEELSDRSYKKLTSMTDGLCGLDANGHAHCWGYSSGDMELGDPDVIAPSASPVAVATPDGETEPLAFTELRHGQFHSCGSTNDGRLFCWGRNVDGQLGNNSTVSVAVPVQILSSKKVIDFELGDAFTCAVQEGDNTWCWGNNHRYQVAVDPEPTWPVPVLSFRPNEFVPQSFGFGAMHACAIDKDHRAHCWGNNGALQLGRETGAEIRAGIDEVEGGHRFTSIVAGSSHTCGLSQDGKTYCWGKNNSGQLGQGTIDDGGAEPTPIVEQ